MPEEALFCPNCGTPVEQKKAAPTQPVQEPKAMGKTLMAGAIGTFLSILINVFFPSLYFLPSFIASLVAIYFFKLRSFNETLVASLMIYLFTDGILGILILGMFYYATNTPFEFSLGVPSLWDVLSYILSPITAFLAGYLGVVMSSGRPPIILPRREEEGPGGVIYSLKEAKHAPIERAMPLTVELDIDGDTEEMKKEE